jgi:hypothetical protein
MYKMPVKRDLPQNGAEWIDSLRGNRHRRPAPRCSLATQSELRILPSQMQGIGEIVAAKTTELRINFLSYCHSAIE